MSEKSLHGQASASGDTTNPDWSAYLKSPRAEDLPYIRQGWLTCYRVSPWAGVVPNNLFAEVYTQAIDQLLARGSKLITVRNPANPAQLLAWCCYETTPRAEVVIHFAFTKPAFRKLGIANAMINHALAQIGVDRFFYTFRTSNARFFKSATFRPEIGRRRDPGSTTSAS